METKELVTLFSTVYDKYLKIRSVPPTEAIVSQEMYNALRYSFMTDYYIGSIMITEKGLQYNDTIIKTNDNLHTHEIILT